MYRFVEFFIQYKQYITLALLAIICFALMSLGNAAELRGLRTIVVGGIGVAQDLFSWVRNPLAVQSENKALRELNYYLSKEVARTRKTLIENEKLRGLLDLRKKLESPVVPAEVLGKTSTQMRSYVTINVGEKQNVSKGMAVLTDRGLVGHIISNTNGYSLVQILPNRDTRIAAKIERTRADGILTWEGGENFLLKNIPKSQDIQAGDMILTSSYSSIYPPDIYIGRVIDVRDEANSLFKRITVAPTVDFNTLEQVFVNMHVPDPERVELEKVIEKKLQNPAKK